MTLGGVDSKVCAGAGLGKNLAEKIGENKGKILGAAVIGPGALAAGITADKWEKLDKDAKEGVKITALIATLVAGAAFLTGKANGQKGVKALTEGAKALWNPIKEGFGKVKGELKTKISENAGKIKTKAEKLAKTGKEAATKLYSTAKEKAGKIAEKIKTVFKKTTEA